VPVLFPCYVFAYLPYWCLLLERNLKYESDVASNSKMCLPDLMKIDKCCQKLLRNTHTHSVVIPVKLGK